jgi:hypothetical protein
LGIISRRPAAVGHLLHYGLPLAQGDRDCGENQRAGKSERRRVAGAEADQAEDGRARAVPGGPVPITAARPDRLGAARRVGLHGIGGYRGNPDTAAPPALVMGFGNVRERAIEPAIAGVADLLS